MSHFALWDHCLSFCPLFCLSFDFRGPGWLNELPNNSYKHITNTAWVRDQLCKLQKGYTRLAASSDKVYQLLVHGRWVSTGTPASSTTKTGRHDIAEILLKVALSTNNLIKIIKSFDLRSLVASVVFQNFSF